MSHTPNPETAYRIDRRDRQIAEVLAMGLSFHWSRDGESPYDPNFTVWRCELCALSPFADSRAPMNWETVEFPADADISDIRRASLAHTAGKVAARFLGSVDTSYPESDR